MDHTVPSRRALIVDDEFLIAFDLESSMRELGFDVCTQMRCNRTSKKPAARCGAYGCLSRRYSCGN
jgi:hypothetical protein